MYSVYVENRNSQIEDMFKEEGWEIVEDVFSCDLLCLDGGADITPEIYGHENTSSWNEPDLDYQTFGLIWIADRLGMPVVGICRGAQALWVYSGGTLVQDVGGHSGVVSVSVRGKSIPMSMDHHQYCAEVEFASGPLYDYYLSDKGVPEIMCYEGRNSGSCFLGWQPHPEWDGKGSLHRKYFFDFVGGIMND